MFEKVTLKNSVFEEIKVKGMRHRAHIFIQESKKCDPQSFFILSAKPIFTML